jgi:hypothetical protein
VGIILPNLMWYERNNRLLLIVNGAGIGHFRVFIGAGQLEYEPKIHVDIETLDKKGTLDWTGDPKRGALKCYVKLLLDCMVERAKDTMPPEKRRAQRYASKIFLSVWPDIQRHSFPGYSFYKVEESKDESLKVLDMESGIDVLVRAPNGTLATISLRIRTKNWESFTLRDTELPKRIRAIKEDTVSAGWHLQVHVENGVLKSYGLIKMRLLAQYLADHKGLEQHPLPPVERLDNRRQGDHQFLAVNFSALRADDVPFVWFPVDAGSSSAAPE